MQKRYFPPNPREKGNIIRRRLVHGQTYAQIQDELDLSWCAVSKVVNDFAATGIASLTAPPRRPAPMRPSLGELELELLTELREECDERYLYEYVDELAKYGIMTSKSSVCRAFQTRIPATLKNRSKLSGVPDPADVNRFMLQICGPAFFPHNKLIVLDGSNCDGSDMFRRKGRAPPGVRIPPSEPFLSRAPSVSNLTAVAFTGVVQSYSVINQTFGAEDVVKFIKEKLGPALPPGTFTALVLDNAPINTPVEVLLAAAEFNLSVIHLPPYSPRFMPVEHTFAQVKSLDRKSVV